MLELGCENATVGKNGLIRPGSYGHNLNYKFISELSRQTENIFVLGDSNFPSIDWENYTASSDIESKFVHYIGIRK